MLDKTSKHLSQVMATAKILKPHEPPTNNNAQYKSNEYYLKTLWTTFILDIEHFESSLLILLRGK